MAKNVAHRHRLGDEGDDPHLAAAPGTRQRKHLIDTCEQQRPGITGRPAVERLFRLFGRCDDGIVTAGVSAAGAASAVTAERSGALGASTP